MFLSVMKNNGQAMRGPRIKICWLEKIRPELCLANPKKVKFLMIFTNNR